MTQYIDKSALIAEIERRYSTNLIGNHSSFRNGKCEALREALSFLDTLEVKEVDFWHLQSKKDIYDSFNDWGLHYFVCLMKDGTIQKFTGCQDESLDGSINLHMNCDDDKYNWEYDDIIYWIEIPNIKAQK